VRTISDLAGQSVSSAVVIGLAVAATITAMSLLRLPVSASQAIVGAILGAAIARGTGVHWPLLPKIVACWVSTPFLGAAVAWILSPLAAGIVCFAASKLAV